MRWFAILALAIAQFFPSAAFAQSPYPLQLPGFHLTLREDKQSNLPLGPSCGGEAALTLTCRVFVLTLDNASARTIYPSDNCGDNLIWMFKKEPRAMPDGWWPVSRTTQSSCKPTASLVKSRLAPGEHIEYAVRLMSPGRSAESFAPGSHTLRATWDFRSCPSDGPDCLTPFDAGRTYDLVPAAAVSNEIAADSPQLPDLGTMKFSFDVVVRPGLPANPERSRSTAGCNEVTSTTINCIVFHYSIGNLGDRAVRNGTTTCSFSGITPEYRPRGGEWKTIRSTGFNCLGNSYFETKILSGQTSEGEFTLATLLPTYDTTPLRTPGEYQLRFTFLPLACFASPDASFCLTRPQRQLPVVSKEIVVLVK